ncbi:glycosyltransferase [Qipengyuania sp. CAU 1752]
MQPQSKSQSGKRNIPGFSAMLCLYKNNRAEEVREAFASNLMAQSLMPDEVIVVFDGPVPQDVETVVEEFEGKFNIRRVVFPENQGHGPARAAAIDACSYSWMAIVDADDISRPDRFEKLLAAVAEYPECAVIGGGYTEFHVKNGEIITGAKVSMPETLEEVESFLQSRSPVAQATAILRVDAIRDVGNYKPWFNNEDYYLWLRLVAAGYKIRNIPDDVLLVRTDPNFYQRRGGFQYWRNEVSLQQYSLETGTTTLSKFLFGATVRFVVQVLLPNRLRVWFYNAILRRP